MIVNDADYFVDRMREFESVKAEAQQRIAQAQVIHERAEGARLFAESIRTQLEQIAALEAFLRGLFTT